MTQKLAIKSVTHLSAQGGRSLQEDFATFNRDKGLFAVADGFGGPHAGDIAAKSACTAVMDFLQREAGDDEATFPFIRRSYYSLAANVLFNSLVHANRQILKQNKGKAIQEKGGASVIAGYLDKGILSIANVGVCSAWLLRRGQWVELVPPRSYSRMIDPLHKESAELDAIPLAALGMAEDLEPEVLEYYVNSGDLVLVQTDGVGGEQRRGILEAIEAYSSMLEAGEAVREGFQSEDNKLNLKENTSFLLVQF